MADVKNGGGYGRFYTPEDTSGATTSSKKTTSLTTTGAVGGLTNSTQDLEKLKKSIISNSTSIGKNITNQIPGVESAKANEAASRKNLNLKDSQTFQSRVSANITPPLPNILSYYNSYNYIFTLSVLTQEAINFPDETYKKGIYGPLILRSASGAPEKELVTTAYGKYDFYIDNVRLSSIIGLDKATGNTNATSFTFNIVEPYSMGLFFQSVQAAALVSGYQNYLDVPLLLSIEFKGHVFDNETQLQNIQIDNSTKHFPLKLVDLNMKVTGKGTNYDIQAYPWNEQGFSTEFNQAKTSVQIYCDEKGPMTVQNILQTGERSLQFMLNDYIKSKAKKDETPNQILILFPSDLSSSPSTSGAVPNEKQDKTATVNASSSANNSITKKLGVSAGTGKNTTLVQATGDASVNKLGQALLGFNLYNKGDTPFPKDDVIYDEKNNVYTRGKIVINPSNSSFKFNQGAAIVDIINQVLLMSDYGRNALDEAQRTKDGKIVWWRVETQVYMIEASESLTSGVKPKLIVYRVVPYEVDSTYVLPVNTKRPQLENLKKQTLKSYNYIYTGKNSEVLDFNIEFKAGFYRALNADGGKNNESKELSKATGGASELSANDQLKQNIIGSKPYGNVPISQQTPAKNIETKIQTTTYKFGGGGQDDASTVAARQFQDLITQGADMINLDLTILGDPYYLGDSGMGNYSAKGVVGYNNITSDGSVNYQNGQVTVEVNFRTPVDINMDTGFYNFGDTKPVAQFSGLYNVISVDSEFVRGKFKQMLKMIRIMGQDNPKADEPTQSSTLSTQAGADSITQTNSNILAAITKKNNNVNSTPPNSALPGVQNTGGVTI